MHRHYSRAPIVEAIIDLQAVAPAGIGLEELREIHKSLIDKYPTLVNTSNMTITSDFQGGTFGASGSEEKIGFVFISPDGKQSVSMKLDGFRFSRLAPYDTWEAMRDEARSLWDVYRSIVKPAEVSRVAVRYVNRIDIPTPFRDFRDYFRTFPEVSTDLPQSLSFYSMSLHIPQLVSNTFLILNQVLLPPQKPDFASVIIDIDVFRDNAGCASDEEVWELLEVVRNAKNEAFEASITNSARELII